MKTLPINNDPEHAARSVAAGSLLLLWGSVSMALGFVLCLTIIGAVIGIPLFLIGFVMLCAIPFVHFLTRQPKTHDDSRP